MNLKIENFIAELNKKFPPHPTLPNEPDTFIGVPGRKYTKIAKSRDGITPSSSYAFVNNETGELFKAASWAAPAKHARGNINDDSGLNACGKYSVVYLK